MDEIEAEVIETPAEAPAEPVNPRDEVNDAVRAAVASLKGEADPPAADIEVEVEGDAPAEAPAPKGDHPTDPARYADGTFKPIKQDAAPAKVAAAPDPNSPPVDNTVKASAPQPSTAAGAPPTSWAAEAKQAWASLPPAIQAAVLKRESEMSAGFAQKSEAIRQYETTLAPIAQAAQRRGISTDEALKSFLAAQDALDRDPRGAIAWLAQSYGVDLAELGANPPAAQPPARPDPVVAQLTQQVSSLQERLSFFDQQHAASVVKAFESQPYFADVMDDLPAIMKEVKASNPSLQGEEWMKAAYDRAIWLNPSVREKIWAAQQAEQAQVRTQQVQQKAEQAKRAAVSVKGSSGETRAPARRPSGDGSVFDDVSAAIAQLRAG